MVYYGIGVVFLSDVHDLPCHWDIGLSVSSDIDAIQILLENGFTVGEVVLSKTRPKHIGGLVLPE